MNHRGALLGLVLVSLVLASVPASAQVPAAAPAFDVFEASIPELQEAMESGRLTAAQLVDAYLARIEAYDKRGPQLNAILWVNANARAEARALDEERARRGPRSALHGIPVILKDNFDAHDMPTTAGSLALAGVVPPDDAFQVRKLRQAGAIILAKANMHELASGVTTISGLGGQTRNPYDPSRNPGGSSGGTGAAVAASFGAVGWGTDTCGSIRIPAAHNNLFGLRPTKGLSSIDGIIPLSHTQDTGGPLARTVTDLAIALDATVGPDPADAATRALEGRPLPRFREALDANALRGARLGVATDLFTDTLEDREAIRLIRNAIMAMKAQGAEVMEVSVPGIDSLLGRSRVVEHEFKFDLADYLAATPAAPVKSLGEILERGLHLAALDSAFRARNRVETRDSEVYRTLLARRDSVREAVLRAMDAERLDALVYPTVQRRPALIGEPQRGSTCRLSAHSGMPALTAPAGFTGDGLPVGVELVGRPFADARLVALAYAFEQATHHRRPPATTPPLGAGRAPEPVAFSVVATGRGLAPPAETGVTARGELAFDVTRSTLSYRVTVSGVATDQIHGVTLSEGEPGRPGPVRYPLSGLGLAQIEGTLPLNASDREALREGRLYLTVYTREHPTGAARGQLALPARPGPAR
ncbi:MAG: CHRD domain-containing protein [Gemmatimonadetes bacterium]|nr:CHRD domain-containing protein [Gemmatimonadota bacterium]